MTKKSKSMKQQIIDDILAVRVSRRGTIIDPRPPTTVPRRLEDLLAPRPGRRPRRRKRMSKRGDS